MKNDEITPKIVDVDIKDGITFTALLNDKELVQQQFDIKDIEKYFGGNPKNNKTTKI
jgi:hypothetical protein